MNNKVLPQWGPPKFNKKFSPSTTTAQTAYSAAQSKSPLLNILPT